MATVNALTNPTGPKTSAGSDVIAAIPERKPLLSIRPPSGWAALKLGEIWQFRDLLSTLAGRDVRLRYRQTALGAAWVIIQPLMGAAIFAFVFGMVAKLKADGLPYFVFAYVGLLGWNAFSSTLTKASASLVGNSQLISKVYFPRMVLPLSTLGSTLIDFGVGLLPMVVMMAIWRITPGWGLLLLPLWLLVVLGLAMGLGLFMSALMVRYRDVQYVLPVMVQFLMYGSPVGYALREVPEHLRIYWMANPLTGVLEGFRWSILGRGQLDWMAVGYSVAMAVILMVAGAISFRRMERQFADVI